MSSATPADTMGGPDRCCHTDVARAHGLPTPVQPHYPVGPAFTAECIRVALTEQIAEWKAQQQQQPRERQKEGA